MNSAIRKPTGEDKELHRDAWPLPFNWGLREGV